MNADDIATRRSIGYALLLTVIWVVAAAIRPTATYHLAPILAAGAAPIGYALMGDRVERALGLALAALATVLVSGAAFLLASAGLLRGPSLLPAGGPLLESLVFALGSGIAGAIVVVWHARAAIEQ